MGRCVWAVRAWCTGAGQFGRVEGYLEPLDDVPGASSSRAGEGHPVFVFDNQVSLRSLFEEPV